VTTSKAAGEGVPPSNPSTGPTAAATVHTAANQQPMFQE